MKHIITILAIVIASATLSANVYGQDVKMVTTSCTIIKPIKFFVSPELDSDGDIYKDGVSVIIKWNPIGDGGSCEAYVKFGEDGEPFLINRWKDYDELYLIRIKNADGKYGYTLRNSMFIFWALAHIDTLDSYGFDSTLREID